MPGRHRAPAPSWRVPATASVAAAALLVFTIWLAGAQSDFAAHGEIPHSASAADALKAAPGLMPRHPASTSAPTTRRSTTTRKTRPTTTTPRTTTTTTAPKASTTRKPPPPPPSTQTTAFAKRTPCSTVLDGTQPHVAQVGNHILTKFDVTKVYGRAERSGTSDHPAGLALDFMVDTATGDALADYLLAHRTDFGVKYVIWRQRYNDGSGWSLMEDRGSVTANHYDHVHVSFVSSADVSVTC